MKKIINHKWAILLAFIAAVIIAYPQVYLRYDHRNVYQGIEVIGASDDEKAWLARAREAKDGHLLGSPFYKEGKNDPYLVQPLGSLMVASLGNIFSLDINNTILLSRFLFSFIVFLIIYSFLILFTKDKLTALVVPTSLFLASSLFTRIALFEFLSGEAPKTSFLDLTRPVNPGLTWFFFFGFLLFFWLFLDTSTALSARKKWIYGGISSLMLGLSFYDYFFTWTFLYAFAGVLILIFFLQKKWLDIKRVIAILLAALLIAVPYFLNLYKTTTFPTYLEIGQRMGLLESHSPVLGFLVPLLFIIFLLFFPKKPRQQFFFGLALVAAPFIVLNQQLITGRILGPAHYHWYFHKPLAVIFLLMILFYWFSRRTSLKKTLAVFIVVASIFYGVFIQNSSYDANEEKIIERQRYGPIMGWFNENAVKEEVVFTDSETAELIVIYTPLNVFYHPNAKYSLAASQERLLDTVFLFYRLEGVAREEAQAVFFRDRRKISWLIFSQLYRETTGDYGGIPDEILLDFSQKYKDSFSALTPEFLNKLWTKYQVKYLVWDKKNNPLWQLGDYPFLERVAEIEDFVIYKPR